MNVPPPLVSIVIPAWNAAAYIEEALGSVRAQTSADWEAIVVDDVSSDDTVERVQAFVASDPRFRLLRQPVNAGPSAARNRGFAEARGTYVALLDADDAYEPRRLADLMALAGRRDADLVSDNLWLMLEGEPGAERAMIPAAVLDGERALALPEFIARNVADPRYPGLNLGFLKPMFRRDFLMAHAIRYDERVRFAEDFALYVDCLERGARWWMSSAPTYRYRVRAGSLTQVQTVHDLGILREKLASLIEHARATGKSSLARLVQRQARVVDRCYHYRAFTDSLKARRFATAFAELSGSGRAAMLILEESARQLPVIVRKAARGGYGSVPEAKPTEPPSS